MNLKNKIKELKPTDLNCNVFDVYNYSELSMQELLCQFFTRINECIGMSNTTLELVEWLVNEGLKQEVSEKLVLWLEDGTLEELINVTLFENLNEKIDNVKNDLKVLEEIKNSECINIQNYKHLVVNDDWTNAIQTAIDDAALKTNWRGIEIIFPRGTYIAAQLFLRSGVILKGTAKGGVFLKQKENTNKDFIIINSCFGCGINNIVIDGNKNSQYVGNGVVIYKNEVNLPEGATTDTTMRLIDLTGTWIKDIKETGLVLGKDYKDGSGASTGAWVFNIQNCFISDCDGYGIKNFTTDNGFTNIDIYNCSMGAVYNFCGDNTRFIGGKWYVNGKDNITKGSLNVVNSKRVVFTSIDLQDNYGHGIFIDRGYNISFINTIVDNAGFHRYKEGQTNRADESLVYITDSTNVSFNGMLENYTELRGLKIKNAITINTSTNTSFNIKCSGVERVVNSIDGSYIDFITKPSLDFYRINGVKSGVRWCLLTTLILDKPNQTTLYKTNINSLNYSKSFDLIAHILSDTNNLERGNSFINCIPNSRNITNNPTSDISNEVYAGVYNNDNKLYCDIWVKVNGWDSLWKSKSEVFTHDREDYLKCIEYNYTFNDMYDNQFSTTSIDKTKYTTVLPINIIQ